MRFLEIGILHAGAPDRPMDADQKGAPEELVGRLEALGVRSGSKCPGSGDDQRLHQGGRQEGSP